VNGQELRNDAGSARPWLLIIELSVIAALFYGDVRHLVPFSKVPFLLLLGWLSLRLRKLRWRDVGLQRNESWPRTILIGLAAGAGIELLELFVTQPLLVRIIGKMPDLSTFELVRHNAKLLVLALVFSWTLAAFGEEMVYRGYLMNRMAGLGGNSRVAWVASLVLVNILFGSGHIGQGTTGMIENMIDGALLGLLYLSRGRSLAAPIIAHGVTDTIDCLLLFLGHYPGI
jgi:uncharacterized protein